MDDAVLISNNDGVRIVFKSPAVICFRNGEFSRPFSDALLELFVKFLQFELTLDLFAIRALEFEIFLDRIIKRGQQQIDDLHGIRGEPVLLPREKDLDTTIRRRGLTELL